MSLHWIRGFGDFFCSVINMLYNDIYSAVCLTPGLTPRFKVQRGIRQGCPISPKLFILATHFLALSVINNPALQGIEIFDRQFRISQFADDTALFLKNNQMVGIALELISLFSKASGLKLNINKCEILPIHTCQYNNI